MAYGVRRCRFALLQNERHAVFKVRTTELDGRGRPGDFVLRIYPPGDPSIGGADSQFRWLSAIRRETDLVVPEPIANRCGEYVTRIQTKGAPARHCTLTRWVKGRRYFRRTGPGLGTLGQVGRLMARLHVHGLQFGRTGRLACPRWDFDGLFGPKSAWYPSNPAAITGHMRGLFARVMRRAECVMQQLGTGPSVFGLIHGDMIQANYLLHQGIVNVIDFADFGRGYFLYDLAVTLLMLCQFERYQQQRSALLRGYREVRPLPGEQEELLNTFIATRAAVLARWVIGGARPTPADLGWAHKTIAQIPTWIGK